MSFLEDSLVITSFITSPTNSGFTRFPESRVVFISLPSSVFSFAISLSACHISKILKPYFASSILA
jgi:hypothetical protein